MTCQSRLGCDKRMLQPSLGLPQSFVSKYETGERRLDVLELREVCRALETSLFEFVERLEAGLG